MNLVKSHGLGNDYLVLDTWAPGVHAPTPGRALTARQARLLCDRHLGLGADGVLEPVPSSVADAGLRIWNPDGSEAEKSGNGLRIFARFRVDHRGAPPQMTVEVPGGIVSCAVDDEAVTVAMGRATFAPAEIPTTEALTDARVEVEGTSLQITAVGLGNPHCVVWVDGEIDSQPWRIWGAALERHHRFPNRTNVQFAHMRGRGEVDVRVWERGAGETAASGSSACAVAVAAFASGRAGADLAVRMPGGALAVHVGADLATTLRGPVEEVAAILVSPALLRKLMVIE